MFEEVYFQRRRRNPAKLLRYGFTQAEDGYHLEKTVMDGAFRLTVSVPETGAVTTRLLDCATEEEYTLHKSAAAAGAFVGSVRSACGQVLTDIAEQCFDPDVFRSQQTMDVIRYVEERFGETLEFLWKKFPDNAVWRRGDTGKWYGAILTVSQRKLGLDAGEAAEIIDLRLPPEEMADTIDHRRYFPGWHMNKKHWYTMLLDGSVPTEEICRRIDESRRLAVK